MLVWVNPADHSFALLSMVHVCLFVLYLAKRCIQYKKVQKTEQLKDNYTKRNRFTQLDNQIVKPGWPIKLAKLCQLISNGVQWGPNVSHVVRPVLQSSLNSRREVLPLIRSCSVIKVLSRVEYHLLSGLLSSKPCLFT